MRTSNGSCNLTSNWKKRSSAENGLSKDEARHAAQRAFGNTTLIREQTHEAWGWASFERFLQDARYALRQLWRAPGFSIVAMMTLALGIGATTAIFTLVYDVMLRPFAVRAAGPACDHRRESGGMEQPISNPAGKRKSLHFLAAAQSHLRFYGDHAAILRAARRRRAPSTGGGIVGYARNLSVLQVQPELGRGFAADEAQRGHEHVAILTYELWQEQFGGDPGILSKTISLDGFPYSVIE